VLRALLLRWLRLPDSLPDVSALRQEVLELRSDLDFLHLQLRRLRGRVTGAIRVQETPSSSEGGAEIGPPEAPERRVPGDNPIALEMLRRRALPR
jgi:hypothetical protein